MFEKMFSFINKFLTSILIGINALIMIFGIVLITIGALTLTNHDYYQSFLDYGFFSVSGLIIFIGISVTFIFFLACCGIAKKNKCMTITYVVIMTILLLMGVGAGIATFVSRGAVQDSLFTSMNGSFHLFNAPEKNTSSDWNNIQSQLHCCGFNGSSDYMTTLKMKEIPTSCCNTNLSTNGNATCNTADPEAIYKDGCLQTVLDDANYFLSATLHWSILVVALQIFAIVGVCFVTRRFNSDYQTV